MHCPACLTEVQDAGNRFCEECGAALSALPVAAGGCSCGSSADDRDEEGFCLRCGKRHRPPQPEDHVEQALSPDFAAVTDRGLHHERNEDRFGIFAGTNGYAIVVCDGVSSSHNAQIASTAVAEAVLQILSEALAKRAPQNPKDLLQQAITAGSTRLDARINIDTRRMTGSRKLRKPDDNPSSTTVVAAVVTQDVITVGWVGDSRAYWIDEQGASPLTRDHSWQNDVVSSGEMSAEQAAKSSKAHAITRWIGADSGCDPDFVAQPITRPGMMLLCTDGLWNYAPTPDEMAARLRAAGNNDALTTAQNLVAYALECGGHDNVTVAVLCTGTRSKT